MNTPLAAVSQKTFEQRFFLRPVMMRMSYIPPSISVVKGIDHGLS
jgi:hypothetical protein